MAKVIVCGLGQVGFRIAILLCRLGEEVTIITQDARPGFVDKVRSMGAVVIIADARDQSSLIEAAIEKAQSLIACTSSDLANIEISLDARSANPKLRIVARIFDQALGQRLEESVGIDETLAMSSLAAPRFAADALRDQAVGSFQRNRIDYFVHVSPTIPADAIQSFAVEGLGYVSILPVIQNHVFRKVKTKDPYVSILKSVPKSLKVLLSFVTLLAIFSTLLFTWAMKLSLIDAFYFVITTLTTTGFGDITPKDHAIWVKLYACWMMLLGSASVAALYSIITETIVSSKLDDITGRQSLELKDHVIVVGIGNVGYRVCLTLHSQGIPVVAIDLNNASNLRQLLPKDIPFLIGDGRDSETLNRASASTAQAVIATTEDDSVNLAVGLVAKTLQRGGRTVIRLFDANFAQKVEANLEIDRALSASFLSAPGFVAAALHGNSRFSFTTESQMFTIREEDGTYSLKIQELQSL